MQFLFSLEEVLDTTDRTKKIGGLVRQIDGLCLIALCELLHHLDVFLGQQVVGRIGALADGLGDEFDGLGLSLSNADTGLCLSFSFEDGLFLGGLGLVDDSGLLTLRGEDLSGLLSLGGQDLGTFVSLGLHLLLHRSEYGIRRSDVLQFDAVHLDAPLVGGIVEYGGEFLVDGVARSERLVEFQFTDDVTQGGLREFLDGVGPARYPW